MYVRLLPRWDSIQVRAAAVAAARELARRNPALITDAWWKEERGERIFIDFNQNAPHKTIFGAWCVRARAGAQVSTPVRLERARHDRRRRADDRDGARRAWPSSATRGPTCPPSRNRSSRCSRCTNATSTTGCRTRRGHPCTRRCPASRRVVAPSRRQEGEGRMTFTGWPDAALDFYVGARSRQLEGVLARAQSDLRRVREGAVPRAVRADREGVRPAPRVPAEPRHPVLQGQDPVQDRGRGRDREAKAARRTTCRSPPRACSPAAATTTSRATSWNASATQVADNRTGPKLAAAVDALRKKQIRGRGRAIRSSASPRGIDPDHPRVELLRMKGIHVGRTFGAPTLDAHRRRRPNVSSTRGAMPAPVNRWLDRNVGPSTLAPPEPD